MRLFHLQSMQAGKGWKASWMRDSAGLEMQRTCSGGITVRTERDRFGRETRKSVRSGSIERGAWRYEWGMADRLLSKENELTGTVMRYDYDRFDFLIRQEITKGSATDVIYRVPDFVGNLYGTPERKDRRYGAGGRLLEDAECIYHYDDEGNLVFREFRQPKEDAVRHDRRQMEREYGIRRPVTDMGWLYEWTSGGMLRRVVRPDGRPVEFRYDALGRRTSKRYLGKVTRWVWDGNTPLHEWVAAVTDNDGREEASCPDGNSLTTWVFEEGTFVPAAKIRGDRQYSIVSDYLGTPVQMYDSEGNKTWDCTLDIYGKVTDFRGESLQDCPFRFQGQYEDAETGLYYNRFRYYDPNFGGYISQDPIRLTGNNPTLYGYINNPNTSIDLYGLSIVDVIFILKNDIQNIKTTGVNPTDRLNRATTGINPGLRGPNFSKKDMHAEIEAMIIAQNKTKSNGGHGILIVKGRVLCPYCKGDVKTLARQMDLDSLLKFPTPHFSYLSDTSIQQIV